MGNVPILNNKITKEFRKWLQKEHYRIYKGQSVKCPKCKSLYCVKLDLKYEYCKECLYSKLVKSL